MYLRNADKKVRGAARGKFEFCVDLAYFFSFEDREFCIRYTALYKARGTLALPPDNKVSSTKLKV